MVPRSARTRPGETPSCAPARKPSSKFSGVPCAASPSTPRGLTVPSPGLLAAPAGKCSATHPPASPPSPPTRAAAPTKSPTWPPPSTACGKACRTGSCASTATATAGATASSMPSATCATPSASTCRRKATRRTSNSWPPSPPLFDAEMKAWQRYRDAMTWLIAPSLGYTGSGTGCFMSFAERQLLDTRTHFLCLLAAGADAEKGLYPRDLRHENTLAELHAAPQRRNLHRHGPPFPPPRAGRAALVHPLPRGRQRLHPRAGRCCPPRLCRAPPGRRKNRGARLLSIETSGKPYEEDKEHDFCTRGQKKPRPEGGMQVRQVFILLECIERETE